MIPQLEDARRKAEGHQRAGRAEEASREWERLCSLASACLGNEDPRRWAAVGRLARADLETRGPLPSLLMSLAAEDALRGTVPPSPEAAVRAEADLSQDTEARAWEICEGQLDRWRPVPGSLTRLELLFAARTAREHPAARGLAVAMIAACGLGTEDGSYDGAEAAARAEAGKVLVGTDPHMSAPLLQRAARTIASVKGAGDGGALDALAHAAAAWQAAGEPDRASQCARSLLASLRDPRE
jgi:hypothetical protein